MRMSLILPLLICGIVTSSDVRAAKITPMGLFSFGYGISDDGSTVVGLSSTSAGSLGFRWTQSEGTTLLGDLSGGSDFSVGLAASADGAIVVGQSNGTEGYEAFRWTTGGFQGLGELEGGGSQSRAYDISADGSVIVGDSQGTNGIEAVRWTSEGIDALGVLNPGDSSEARGVSADGSVIVGTSRSSGAATAFRWTEAAGMQALDEDFSFSAALDISADGSTIVGYGSGGAIRWTETTNEIELLAQFEDHDESYALAASGDGSRIVGYAYTPGDRIPTLWENGTIRNLRDVLIDDYQVDMTGWDDLYDAYDISADGTRITGTGLYQGTTMAYLVDLNPETVPEPGSIVAILSLLASGGLVALRRRRKSATAA